MILIADEQAKDVILRICNMALKYNGVESFKDVQEILNNTKDVPKDEVINDLK